MHEEGQLSVSLHVAALGDLAPCADGILPQVSASLCVSPTPAEPPQSAPTPHSPWVVSCTVARGSPTGLRSRCPQQSPAR